MIGVKFFRQRKEEVLATVHQVAIDGQLLDIAHDILNDFFHACGHILGHLVGTGSTNPAQLQFILFTTVRQYSTVRTGGAFDGRQESAELCRVGTPPTLTHEVLAFGQKVPPIQYRLQWVRVADTDGFAGFYRCLSIRFQRNTSKSYTNFSRRCMSHNIVIVLFRP